jgi:hypothetical protein
MVHQQKHSGDWWKYVEQEQLVSAMNATKWRELTEAMRLLHGGPPAFRVKEIWSDKWWPESYWDREWYYHPRPWEEIEWLEIQSDPRHDQIVGTLNLIGVPFSIESGHIRVWGWLRPSGSVQDD